MAVLFIMLSILPRVRWEGPMNEEKKAEYEEKTRQLKVGGQRRTRMGDGVRWWKRWLRQQKRCVV